MRLEEHSFILKGDLKMSIISFRHKGDFNRTFDFLRSAEKRRYLDVLDSCGQMGVDVLSQATPKDSGNTAESWSYEIEKDGPNVRIIWNNSNINQDVNVAIILQYGHGTGTGGYVQGIDYINPALKPVFDRIADLVWKGINEG